MLSTNVLCIKKRKKRSYCIANKCEYGATSADKNKRSASGAVTMLQITEDTPPDMLAGAMDLTVHLPNGRPVKMAVERSTPMMDLLVQITTHHQLQLSGYTLQALDMTPSTDRTDRFLPFKPNTPIGALDTQHVKVIPKSRSVPVKNQAPGHQPFESTFRLKVHLPRNQLFVTRVSQSVHLEDVMKKVCAEKNLDPVKYEFRHPANLDEVLDPKLSLSDYQITETYLVSKGSGNLNQAFSTSDIMALRKEEERKQMHTKTGGGVFNLIFRRGKSNNSGSLSSENRSISPTQSDDSRSVTPPAVQQQIITPPQQQQETGEKPKPPQRKRRPAPKPPQIQEEVTVEKPGSNISDSSSSKKSETAGLIISHSRNSSDSSGYHEASILSDNNTSLPRRPKSTMIIPEDGMEGSNLGKMAAQSKSTSSLAFANRKKKSAPPPPQVAVLKPAESIEKPPSPVVASQPALEPDGNGHDILTVTPKPLPVPRTRTKHPQIPRTSSNASEDIHNNTQTAEDLAIRNTDVAETEDEQNLSQKTESEVEYEEAINPLIEEEITKEQPEAETVNPAIEKSLEDDIREKQNMLLELQKQSVFDIFKTDAFVMTPPEERPPKKKPPEIVAFLPKAPNKEYSKSMFDSYTRKRGFLIGSSLISESSEDNSLDSSANKKMSSDLSTTASVASALEAFNFDDEIDGTDLEMFTGSISKSGGNKARIFHELHGIHDLAKSKNYSSGSLRSVPGFVGGNIKKWGNVEDLDDISLTSGLNSWVIGDTSDTESTISAPPHPVDASLTSIQSLVVETKLETPPKAVEDEEVNQELDNDWQYQLPSPPKGFRDASPVVFAPPNNADESDVVDSVVTSPELFDKLNAISDMTSVVSEEDKPILNKLSLENLEKRQSLVYNRELATSFRMSEEITEAPSQTDIETFSNSLTKFEKTYEEMRRSSLNSREVAPPPPTKSTLPNFKITTYDNPKQKLNIFEDDTIRSNTNSQENSKRNSLADPTNRRMSAESNLHTSYRTSMENISFLRKSSLDQIPDEPDYKFYKPKVVKNLRSESFSSDQWTPLKPVTRSKSQVALNRVNNKPVERFEEESPMAKSNSLFDVSGLQSLGVMRQIQNKLNTPTNSLEDLVQEPVKPPTKTYQYQAPSINMGTWSDRPKVPVNVKDDPDYKFSNNNTKLIVNTVNNEVRSNNTVEIRGANFIHSNNTKNVSIKVNGSEPISAQHTGNVVIKIGDSVTHRKPLGNINKIDHNRPHSVAFGDNFDISRVPIVRSVELKRPYKDQTSVTNMNGYSTENVAVKVQNEPSSKPAFRVNSYFQNSNPTVRGFRAADTTTNSDKIRNNNNRFSWSQPHSFSTLPSAKSGSNNVTNILNNSNSGEKEFTTNKSVPFSQLNLRRTESTKIINNVPPPAPVMPKTLVKSQSGDSNNKFSSYSRGGDPKEQLLQAIRDFGGKKGLRAGKA